MAAPDSRSCRSPNCSNTWQGPQYLRVEPQGHGHFGGHAYLLFVHSCRWRWPMPSQGVQSISREQSGNCYEGAMHEARNMGSLAVKDHGILNTPPPPRFTSSSPSFPFRRSDAPPSFSPSRHDDGILPTPHFSTRLPPHSYLRRSGSSPKRLGPSQTASSAPVSRATPSTFGAHPLSFSALPSPSHPLSPPSPQQPPVLTSPSRRSPLLPSLPSLLASLHSLLLHLRQVAQCG